VVDVQREVQQTFKERVITEGSWDEKGGADNIWVKLASCIRKVARELLE
jgi:hypothetical protein